MRATCHVNPILLHFNTPTIFGGSNTYGTPHYAVLPCSCISSLLSLNIPFGTLFLYTFILCSSLRARDQFHSNKKQQVKLKFYKIHAIFEHLSRYCVVLWEDITIPAFHPEDKGSMFLRNVGTLQHYTASRPRRPRLETRIVCSPP